MSFGFGFSLPTLGWHLSGGGASSGYSVTKSLRFRSSASAYLNRTPTTTGSRTTFTWSGWVKRGALGTGIGNRRAIFASGRFDSPNHGFYFRFFDDQISAVATGGTTLSLTSSAVYRDPAAWYHFVLAVDTTQGTASDRVKIYVNGSQVTSFGTATYPSASQSFDINTSSYTAYSGTGNDTGTLVDYFDGEMAEINFVDGQALAPTAFGAYSIYNQWLPIAYAGTYGTNGFYLPFGSNNNNTATANYLVVAGGGGGSATFGGGYGGGGGGGAGGYRTGTLSVAAASAYTVTIGTAGLGGTTAGANGTNGGDSVFSSITSTGGGHGDSLNGTAANGGSGGGKGYGGASTFGTGTVGQGNNGGSGTAGGSGGGGGASAVGGNGTDAGSGLYPQTGGAGGAGSSSSISGSAVTYAGGGGAGGYANAGGGVNGGAGGSGGGGAGGGAAVAGSPGTANTGGGGGGGGGANLATFYAGANGGSGIVIISYAGAQIFTGGTVTTSGGNTIHTFTTSGTLTGIFNDQSGNGNNWTPNNISLTAGSTYDSLTDVPTLTSTTVANYAVWNAVAAGIDSVIDNGNLRISYGSASTRTGTAATMGMTTGKFYWEVTVISSSANDDQEIGISNTTANTSVSSGIGYYPGYTANGWGYEGTGNKITGAVATAYGATYTVGDVIGVAFDATAGSLTFYKNNVSQGVAFSSLPATTYFPAVGDGGGTGTVTYAGNFGQQPFVYTAPTGFLPLNTFNI